MFFRKIVVLVVCTSVALAASGSWSYNPENVDGPDKWDGACNGTADSRQSPIDIVTSNTEKRDKLDWQLTGWDQAFNWTVVDKSYTVQYNLDGDITTSGGGLPGTYKMIQFHMHWGANSTKGSEHTVNGMSYPLEMHCVHLKDEYANATEALNSNASDALAAVGFLFNITAEDNPALNSLIEGINLTQTNQIVNAHSLGSLVDLVGEVVEGGYWRYNGGLTTPLCNEQVVWTVFQTPIPISVKQMTVFRQINGSSYGTERYRPTQPLNGRKVINYTYITDDVTKGPSGSITLLSSGLLVLSAVILKTLLQ